MTDPTTIQYCQPEEPTLGEILARCLQEKPLTREEWVEQHATSISGHELARHLAHELDVTPEEAVRALRMVSLNMTPLFDSPEGWSVLAGYVATFLGCRTAPDFLPTSH